MAGRDGMMGRPNAIQLDRLLAERINHYEPDSQIRAGEFHPRLSRPKDAAITRKIMADHDYIDDNEPPAAIMDQLRLQQKPPYERFELPMTTAQEYGFYNTTPMIAADRTDSRMNFPRNNSEITEIPDLYTRDKNQEKAKKLSLS
ncbi:hypothetical protein BV898_09379 [Hypsibius exemplaris]|uniref:Uncharacterized protein n=1 Tax=Hypsibius exemplaris TaxID=2072580 RepID=A0A1W0WMY3_HYPEX|nr:hypothetical protein BV898_09379 [Hypsibius exemplaris]